MKKTFLLIALSVLLVSCQNSQEAQIRHNEMKELLSVYKLKSIEENKHQKALIEQLQLKIEKLNKQVKQNSEKVNNLGTGEFKDSVQAALSLANIPNRYIQKSLISILSELGGKAAEEGIIQITRKGDSSTISSGLSALKKINSPQLKNICFELLEGDNFGIKRYALQYLSEVVTKDDMPKLHKVAANLPRNNNNYDARYCWSHLFKAYLAQGDDSCLKVCAEVLKHSNLKNVTNAAWAAIIIAKYGTEEQVQQACKTLRPLLNQNSSLSSDVNYWLRENAHIKMYPVMELIKNNYKVSSSYRNNIYQAYVKLNHPIAAKSIVEGYKTTTSSSTKSMLIKAFQGGFPGTMWFEKEKKAATIPDNELEQLIKDFK